VKAALRRPGRVLSLSVFEPVTMGLLLTASGDEAAAFDAEMWALREPGSDPGGEAWLRRFIDWWQGPGAWDALPGAAKGQFLAVGKKVFLEVNSLTTDRMTADDLLPLRMPALVLRGERSPRSERRVCDLLAQALPRGTLRQLDGVGHLAPVTHAAQVNALVAAHIESAEQQAAAKV
jgi:pimeloyl-ACP methyl ester carboxylesterase